MYKPYRVLSQFTDEGDNKGINSTFQLHKGCLYPVGRLDVDSEDLIILTNDKTVNSQLLNPKFKHQRTYWVEVEGSPDLKAMQELRAGVSINLKEKTYRTLPCDTEILDTIG